MSADLERALLHQQAELERHHEMVFVSLTLVYRCTCGWTMPDRGLWMWYVAAFHPYEAN